MADKSKPSDSQRIIAFYRGTGVDDSGRTLHDVLRFSFDQLEVTHDYIQWLFPLDLPSSVQPFAPLVDDSCRQAFRHDGRLRDALGRSLRRMLEFYGLSVSGQADRPTIGKASGFSTRAANWLSPGNHNFLRLTRMMTSLELLGGHESATALWDCLERIYDEFPEVIGRTTIGYWRRAIHE